MITIQISFKSSSKYAWILNPQKLERESFFFFQKKDFLVIFLSRKNFALFFEVF